MTIMAGLYHKWAYAIVSSEAEGGVGYTLRLLGLQ